MRIRETQERLASVPLFEGLSKRELRQVVSATSEVTFPEGRSIVEEGADAGAGFHLILDGEVRVIMAGRTRARLGPGEFFGEISLLDGGPRTATVLAQTPVRTLSIPAWNFIPILDRNPTIARKLLVEVAKRLRAVQRRPIA